jgi:hypothetical protein
MFNKLETFCLLSNIFLWCKIPAELLITVFGNKLWNIIVLLDLINSF